MSIYLCAFPSFLLIFVINTSEINVLTSLSSLTHEQFVHLAALYESANWQENHRTQPPVDSAAAPPNLIWTERFSHQGWVCVSCTTIWRKCSKWDSWFSLFAQSLFIRWVDSGRREGGWAVVQLSPVSREVGAVVGAFGGWRVQLSV